MYLILLRWQAFDLAMRYNRTFDLATHCSYRSTAVLTSIELVYEGTKVVYLVPQYSTYEWDPEQKIIGLVAGSGYNLTTTTVLPGTILLLQIYARL